MKKRTRKELSILLALLLAISMIVLWAVPATAATTADVTVQATPEYIAITDNVTTLDFGTVSANTSYSTDTDYVGITNSSSVQTDITISVTTSTWAGGVTWTHSDTGTQGADQAGLESNRGGTWDVGGDIIVKNASPNYIYENCPATTDFDYGLQLNTPTSYTDGVQKSITVRISAAAG